MNYSKHPPKSSIQEFGKTTFPTFGPSVRDRLLCSISPKIPKCIIQNIPEKYPSKNSTKQPPKISDHLLYFFADLQIRSIMVCT